MCDLCAEVFPFDLDYHDNHPGDVKGEAYARIIEQVIEDGRKITIPYPEEE